jgi:hypothetical protein
VLLLAAAAAGFAAGFLVGVQREAAPPRREGGGAAEPRDGRPPPPSADSPPAVLDRPRVAVPLPDVVASAKARPQSPRTQKELATFVMACAARGAEAVEELLRFLRTGEDVQLQPLWQLAEGELKEYPSLRSAYIEALRLVPGKESTEALQEVFRKTASLGESCLAALALAERGEGGWGRDLLERAAKAEGAPHQMHLVRQAAELAGASDPAAAEEFLFASAPRGGARADPMGVAAALTTLPAPSARAAALRLLGDPAVTVLAKSRYVRAIGARRDPEAMAILREALELSGMEGDLRVDAANAAVNSPAIAMDLGAIDVARANGDGAAESAARQRVAARIQEARRVVGVALGVDPANTDDARAATLLRRLAEFEKAAGLAGR